MLSKIKILMMGAVVGGSVMVGLMSPVSAVTCPTGSARAEAPTYAECSVVEDNSLWPTVNNGINMLVYVLGFVAIVVIILGGFQYAMSQGDPGKVKKAKDTIMYGVIGLVVAILAFAIVNFVLSSLFGGSGGGGGDGGSSDV